MHTSMKVAMLDIVTDVKTPKLILCLSLFLPNLSHKIELIL